MSAEPWFVTVMMPTIFPVGPDGWTTFWTDALIVRWVSSTKVTVIRNRVGDAIAVSKRTTERMGSGARCFFLPHGARRKRVAIGTSPRNPNRGTAETNPIDRDRYLGPRFRPYNDSGGAGCEGVRVPEMQTPA